MSDDKNKLPWYRKSRELYIDATKYLLKYEFIDRNLTKISFENFEKETLARFIFESNNIEKEGLTFGQTKDFVLNGLEKIKKNNISTPHLFELPKYDVFRHNLTDNLPINVNAFPISAIKNCNIVNFENLIADNKALLIAQYGMNNREALTVQKHFISTLLADNFALGNACFKYYSNTQKMAEKQKNSNDDQIKQKAISYLNSHIYDEFIEPKNENLIIEEKIIKLHETMAEGLISKEHAQAGNYRKHPIMTDLESHFPAPEVVPDAMKYFFEQCKKIESIDINPITYAAWASTQFVLIHPFSDFNGRMSRLIMNMILRTHNLPFWVSLRSNNKDKKRYLTSLKHYQRGKRNSIRALISMQIIEIFSDLNSQLKLANYPIIDIKGFEEKISTLSDDNLFFMRWPYPWVRH